MINSIIFLFEFSLKFNFYVRLKFSISLKGFEPLAMTAFGIYFGLGRIHMPLGYYTMQWMNQGPPSIILLSCDVIYQFFRFKVRLTSSSDMNRCYYNLKIERFEE